MKRLARMLRKTAAIFALALTIFVVGRAEAASQAEMRDYDAAVKDFDINQWQRAEAEAKKFIENPKYTNSENFAKVVLIAAQAQYRQKQFNAMVDLLIAQQGRAGSLGDDFAWWLAQGYASRGDFHEAADTFARLVRNYPNSPRRAEAIFDEADARSKLKDWAGVTELLSKPDGAFQQLAKASPTNTSVMNGQLLLAEAQANQGDYAGAEQTLHGMGSAKTDPKVEWQRLKLLCEAQLAAGRKEAAQTNSVKLIEAANGNPDWTAQSMELKARILEELDQLSEAVKVYDAISQNDSMPADRRRRAFLQSVELSFRQNKMDEADQKITDYSNTHPEMDTNGLEALTLGELKLRKYYLAKSGASAIPGETNNLALAKAKFEGIIESTNSEYAGKAELNLGWCLWEEKNYSNSLVAFSNAVQKLPFSTEQAVARFKMGDSLYELKDLAGATNCYTAVIRNYGSLTAVKNDLFERALYQLVRAGLEQTNLDLATNALNEILELFPDGLMGQPSMLLVGQGLSSKGNTADARALFENFLVRFPQSALVPEVKLAIARTYEAEGDWPRAMKEYDDWVGMYPKSPSLPRAEFARAQVNYEAGRETNAFRLFTNFVAEFPSNELALKAQYWIGDYYWRQPDYVSAEAQYQEVYRNKNWPESKLQYEALMMAGRAAMARENYGEAIGYFTNLVKITNCPLDLRLQALFAAGDAKMQSAATGTATNMTIYAEAVKYFYQPITEYSNNRIAALAWGKIGNCNRLMGSADPAKYKDATNAYQQVMNSPLADISARSMAECGLAMSLEAMARLKPVGKQLSGFEEAVGHYLNVAEGENRRDNETTDAFWVKEAGKAAGTLLDEDLGEWDKAVVLYQRLAEDLPSWRSYWQKRIEAVNKSREKQVQPKAPAGG